jgi:hypothetical protein
MLAKLILSTRRNPMFQKFFFGLFVVMSVQIVQAEPVPAGPPNPGAVYHWGRGADGTGYCFEFTVDGQIQNGGRPVPEYLCEEFKPSYYDWAQANNGYGYCFQFTPQHLVMWQGRPIPNSNCEKGRPSYYALARASDGWVYCFQFTPYGHAMNDGRPVPNHFCQRP